MRTFDRLPRGLSPGLISAETHAAPCRRPWSARRVIREVRSRWPNNPDNLNLAVRWSADYRSAPAISDRTDEELLQERLNVS